MSRRQRFWLLVSDGADIILLALAARDAVRRSRKRRAKVVLP